MKNIFGKARAFVVNAAVWGVAWGTLAFATLAGLMTFGALDDGIGLLDCLGMAIRIGFAGGLVSVAFSALVRQVYRGLRLVDISPLKFGLMGAAVAGIGLPLFMQTANVLTGGSMIAWKYIADDVPFATVFGGLAAGLSLLVAQRAARRDPGALGEGPELVGVGAAGDFAAADRRSAIDAVQR